MGLLTGALQGMGNGMITSGYYRSFPHSLLSTSKFVLTTEYTRMLIYNLQRFFNVVVTTEPWQGEAPKW